MHTLEAYPQLSLKKLKEACYLKISKTFKDNKPHTPDTVPDQGLDALKGYVEEMEGIIKSLKKQ